jgi:subtilisin-like proprotein convertase family protein
MLEANPELGWRDVQHILVDSASKVDINSTGWFTNAAGKEFNNDYGFGRINADAAVTLAKGWTNVSSERTFANSESPGVQIPDSGNGVLKRTISIDQDIQIESIEIPFISNHTYIGDLGITLTSPGGTIATLAESRDDGTSGINFTFSAKAFWGESSKGNWTLTITDEVEDDTGILESWGINVYGTPGVNYDDQLGRGSSIQYDEVTGQASSTYATAEALASVPSLASHLHYLETISKNVDIHESPKMIVATTGKKLRGFSQFECIEVNRKGKVQANEKKSYKIFEIDADQFDNTKKSQGLAPIIESLGEDLAFAYPDYVLPRTSRSSIQDSSDQFPIC